MIEPVRLAKRIAELRGCSRREAELLIAGGWVQVDGIMVEEAHFRVTDQRIDIDPAADLEQAQDVTMLLHQPAGTLAPILPCATSHWAEDPGARRILKKHFTQLTPCLPLEPAASGLVVWTQDWRIVRKLTADAATLEHELLVDVAGELPENGLKRMTRALPQIKLSWQSEQRLRVAMKGAHTQQIAHLCETAGLQVLSMKRIRLGGVAMGKLPSGQWRYLREGERF
ncbi:RNA pseudouridine synthase [Acidovorax sp.]|uniref:RNA pseudouridine synthase n=1 Tax=Acidovorax sp. TaxID=1872122 RepID=UPI000BCA293A|nr:RNA pseudouridine synthase [Acidovorax sp.]OYW66311.1 MAG: RNA-binding protein [Hydrogenophilales bacterium 12-64-13]OYZ05893.1 MAG: RNA-binding protein [Hydrogenophilales bacterium 16-64-46]OZA39829.1 MAG: RNA-binding protein [Hydrogenophilales bacterium 17-64-34]HQT00249.1 RNA pseudouridine synthase [Thiobacillus sp.]